GIWHGANWTFVAWGLFYFALLVLEKYGPQTTRLPTWTRRLVTLLLVMIAWVLFRADTLQKGGVFLGAMFGLGSSGLWSLDTGFYLREYWVFLLAAVLCSVPSATWLRGKLKAFSQGKRVPLLPIWDGLCTVGLVGIFLVSAAFLIKGTYNPFIYFNF
ncbi:MAG: MBOAT family protein, partial [Oscillospiraceae bacterium]